MAKAKNTKKAEKTETPKDQIAKAKKAKKVSPFSVEVKDVKIPGLGVMPVDVHTVVYGDQSFSHTRKIECKAWHKGQKEAARTARINPDRIRKQAARSIARSIQVLGQKKTDELIKEVVNA